jgi:hypothetical protein
MVKFSPKIEALPERELVLALVRNDEGPPMQVEFSNYAVLNSIAWFMSHSQEQQWEITQVAQDRLRDIEQNFDEAWKTEDGRTTLSYDLMLSAIYFTCGEEMRAKFEGLWQPVLTESLTQEELLTLGINPKTAVPLVTGNDKNQTKH